MKRMRLVLVFSFGLLSIGCSYSSPTHEKEQYLAATQLVETLDGEEYRTILLERARYDAMVLEGQLLSEQGDPSYEVLVQKKIELLDLERRVLLLQQEIAELESSPVRFDEATRQANLMRSIEATEKDDERLLQLAHLHQCIRWMESESGSVVKRRALDFLTCQLAVREANSSPSHCSLGDFYQLSLQGNWNHGRAVSGLPSPPLSIYKLLEENGTNIKILGPESTLFPEEDVPAGTGEIEEGNDFDDLFGDVEGYSEPETDGGIFSDIEEDDGPSPEKDSEDSDFPI